MRMHVRMNDNAVTGFVRQERVGPARLRPQEALFQYLVFTSIFQGPDPHPRGGARVNIAP